MNHFANFSHICELKKWFSVNNFLPPINTSQNICWTTCSITISGNKFKIVSTAVQILYNFFTIKIYNQLYEKDIEENNLKRRVKITPWFILTIGKSSWCQAWYVMWFFRYISLIFIVELDYMFNIKESDIIDTLLCSVFKICFINHNG